MNLAVFCSGKGTNLQAIINAIRKGEIEARIALVISDRKDAYALRRAKDAGIKAVFVNPKDFSCKRDFEVRLISYLKEERVELVVLAGFMRILSPFFVREYKHRILNIHPSLLPAFKGSRNAVRDALEYGVKITGVTVHFVDEQVDNGPIILQKAVEVSEEDSEESLRERIHQKEHLLYPLAIKLVVEGRIRMEGRRVRIDSLPCSG